MDPSKPSKSRKPSLPHLTINVPVPAARRSSTSLKNIDPNPQQPLHGPAVFLDDKKDVENIAPFLRYAPGVKPPVVRQNQEQPPITKSKLSYFEDSFNYRGVHNSPQDRVAQGAIIVADLKTNYKVCFAPTFSLLCMSQADNSPRAKMEVTSSSTTFFSDSRVSIIVLKLPS